MRTWLNRFWCVSTCFLGSFSPPPPHFNLFLINYRFFNVCLTRPQPIKLTMLRICFLLFGAYLLVFQVQFFFPFNALLIIATRINLSRDIWWMRFLMGRFSKSRCLMKNHVFNQQTKHFPFKGVKRNSGNPPTPPPQLHKTALLPSSHSPMALILSFV